MKAFAPIVAALALAGCTTTPYPNGTPIYGASVEANTAPRGSPEFCETYARQSAGNSYDTNSDSNESFGSNAFEANRARAIGEAAYRRCLAGRTG